MRQPPTANTAALASCTYAVALLGSLLVPSLGGTPVQATPGIVLARGAIAGILAGLAVAETLPPLTAALLAAGAALSARILLWPSYGAATPLSSLGAVVLAAAIALLVGTGVRSGLRRAAAGAALVAVLCLFGWRVGLLPGEVRSQQVPVMRRALSVSPQPEGYRFDGHLYLRTYFLMKEGTPYVRAFEQAHDEDSRLAGVPPSKLSYREPALFAFWTAIPGPASGLTVYWSYVWFGLLVIVGSYLVGVRLVAPPAALLGPLAVSAYLAMPTGSTYFTFSEFWGGGLAVLCLAALLRRRWLLGAALLAVAVAVRELSLLIAPAVLIALPLYARDHPRERVRLAMAAALAAIAPPVVLVAHFVTTPAGWSAGAAPWLHGGLSRLSNALTFAGDLLPAKQLLMPAAAVFAILVAYDQMEPWRRALLGLSVGLPVVALMLASSGSWGYYWGAIVQPMALSIAPAAFAGAMPEWRFAVETDGLEG